MTPPTQSGSQHKDDGFRISEEAIDQAVAKVLTASTQADTRGVRPWLAMAASIAVILGLGVALSEALKPDPCVTFACQLELLTDEELADMLDLMEEETLLGWEAEEWTNLY